MLIYRHCEAYSSGVTTAGEIKQIRYKFNVKQFSYFEQIEILKENFNIRNV